MIRFYLVAFILFSSTHQCTTDGRSSYTYTFKSSHTIGTVLERRKGCNRVSCALFCSRKASCTTAIVDERKGTCFLSQLSEKEKGELRSNEIDGRFLYIQMLGSLSGENNGSYKDKAFKNCKTLKDLHPDAPSGVYWIDPSADKGHVPRKDLQAYCDQETEGGGWTLVWTYTFTNYNNFNNPRNAVTPLPRWGHANFKRCDSPISITAPLSEDQTGAMPFPLWSKIGSRFLIKSNIMNWISCSPSKGSLVNLMRGTITCKVVRHLNAKCRNVVPDKISPIGLGCGLRLIASRKQPAIISRSAHRPPYEDSSMPRSYRRPPFPPPSHRPSRRPPHGRCIKFTYIDFNGSQTRGWPVHDPCGACSPNHPKGVANPRVNVYVRA